MVLYLLVIVAANVGLGYALIVYLNRRARLLSWMAQQSQGQPASQTTDGLSLGDARQLKATIDDGLSQITRETPSDFAAAPVEASEPAEELVAATS